MGPTFGVAKIYLDGRYRGSIDLHGVSAVRLIEFGRTFGPVGWHTITIKVAGTSGHPRVDLDGFLVLY